MRPIAHKLIILLATLLTTVPSSHASAGKKLIEYGWDVPSTAAVREKVREMEKIPFDGIVIKVMQKAGSDSGEPLGWRTFSKQRFTSEEYEHAITDLRATRFERFSDNFIQMVVTSGVDWFDPEWDAIAFNASCLAKVAKLGGCRGIMLDTEDYGSDIWRYKAQTEKAKDGRSLDEYFAKVKRRGSEFMRAINTEYPDITLLCLFGPSLPYAECPDGDFANSRYGLLMAFFEGMLEAATPGTTIVDAYEESYGFRERELFPDVRKMILTHAKTVSRNPVAYTKHIRAGFGVWADNNSGEIGWHPDDFSKNYYTPAGLRATLAWALESADRYVWVYSERLRWWDFNVPKAYVDALALAKTGPGPGESQPLHHPNWHPAKAAQQPGYSDDETFAKLRRTMTEVLDLPKDGWRFRRDKASEGESRGWQKPGFDDSSWRAISIGKFWEEQGEDYDGRAWYRRSFTAPRIGKGKRVFLAVGSADESARVWLNGKLVGEHDIGLPGWKVPFALDVTSALKPGQENLLAIQVHDRMQSGGLWKSVKVMEGR